MREERVIAALDARSIYHVPTAYSREGLDAEVCKYFGLDAPAADLDKWRQITEVMENPEGEVRIAVVGKYQLLEAYKSLNEALAHGGIANRFKVKIKWVDAEDVEKDGAAEHLSGRQRHSGAGRFRQPRHRRQNCRRPAMPGKTAFPGSAFVSACKWR